jgi:putative endonuclease
MLKEILERMLSRLRPSQAKAAASAPHLELGREGEEQAAQFLERRGLRILERGWRSPLGQIDLIARDGDTIVFIEVKTRSTGDFGLPEEAVTDKQRRRIVRAALAYLKRLPGHPPARFDVVAIDDAGPRHYKDAFPAEGWTY